MPRGRKKRTWVKLDCQGVLHGSINWLFTLEEQAVFLKLIPMAAVYCKEPGVISDNEGKPLSEEYIAYELHCPVETLRIVIQKGTEDSCLRKTENGCLELAHFQDYQFGEYDRQRPWRQEKKKLAKMTPEEREAYWRDPARQKENLVHLARVATVKEKK
jgi:hypothetical protein